MIRLRILPSTRLGTWSAGLLAAAAVLLLFMQLLVASGQQGGETFADNLWLAVPGFAAATSGVASGILGVLAVLRRRERAVLVFAAIAVACLVLFFVLGEILVPH